MVRLAIIGISFLATTFFSALTIAEDAIDADPKHYTVEFENDKIRLIRIKYGPREKSVMHTHGPRVSVYLTDNDLRMTMPDGTSREVSTKTSTAQWSDASEHLPENLSNHPLEVILVELKE